MTISLREFVDREVHYCVSTLVGDLARIVNDVPSRMLKHTSFDADEIMSLCQRQRPDYESAADYYADSMGRDDLIVALDAAGVEDERDHLLIEKAAALAWQAALENNPACLDEPRDFEDPWVGFADETLCDLLKAALGVDADGYKDFVEEHNIDFEYDEVYEHWLVSDWLAERLKEKGETTSEVAGLTIWGRCTTGQSIMMDGVIQSIYKGLTGNDVTSADY